MWNFFSPSLLDSEKNTPWNEYLVRWNRRNKIENTNGYSCIPKEGKSTEITCFLNFNFILVVHLVETIFCFSFSALTS